MRPTIGNTFFTSDIHFFHKNIINYCNRPFADVDEMTDGIVKNWNNKVPEDGITFILGDLAMGGSSRALQLADILSKLNGKKYLVPGNHDSYVMHSKECLAEITVLPPLHYIKLADPDAPRGSQRIVMCHYAMKVWDRAHHGAWQLYGHSHHSMPRDYSIKAIDVGIDGPGYNYAPLSYADVKSLMNESTITNVDHHNSTTT